MTDLSPERVLIEAKIAGHKTETGYVFNSNEEAARIAVAALRAHHLLRGEGERDALVGKVARKLHVMRQDPAAWTDTAMAYVLVDAILDPPTVGEGPTIATLVNNLEESLADAKRTADAMAAEGCEECGHLLSDHDGMGDCRHLDGRTATGFCTCADKRGTT